MRDQVASRLAERFVLRPTRICLLPMILALAAGCSHRAALTYKPVAGDQLATAATVRLVVVDEREPSLGGADKTKVGYLRGIVGDTVPFHESGVDRVRQLMEEATIDALTLARIGVNADSARILTLQVMAFWMDGYIGYKGIIEAHAELRNTRGDVLWKDFIKAGGGASGVSKRPSTLVSQVFDSALADYVQKASGVFSSDAFQDELF
jgi:hypothetical protein